MFKTVKISSKEIVMIIAAILCFIVAAFAQKDSVLNLENAKGKILLLDTNLQEAANYIASQKQKHQDYFISIYKKETPKKVKVCPFKPVLREEETIIFY